MRALSSEIDGKEFLCTIKKENGFKFWNQLANKWGIPASTLSTWVKSGSFSLENAIMISEQEGISLEWMLTKKGKMRKETRPTIPSDTMSDLTGYMNDTIREATEKLFEAHVNSASSAPPVSASTNELKKAILGYLNEHIALNHPLVLDASEALNRPVTTINWILANKHERFSVDSLLSILESTKGRLIYSIQHDQ